MASIGERVEAERRAIPGQWPAEPQAAGVLAWLAGRIAVGDRTGVVRIGLSRFDIVNAAYGRDTGRVLIEASGLRIERVARRLFGNDYLVVRVAGSDYLLAASGDRLADAGLAIEAALAEPFDVDGGPALVGARIGLAIMGDDDDADALLARAADALAIARDSDAAAIHAADPDDGIDHARSLDTLAVDLHGGIARGEILVLFQPQVELASGRIIGAEALARWDHPTLGPVGAEQLFAAAARADLGRALSHHVQRLALAEAGQWGPALAHLRLSLNVTAADLSRSGFPQAFLARIDASGFPRDRLTIEMTENALIGDLAAAATWFGDLRAGGCRMAIDDFGAGYSSLAYLQILPLDYIKLDKELIADLADSARAQTVVSGVIGIGHALGLSVIVEGVETEAQRAVLADLGSDLYQGFLCAEPLDGAALAALVGG